MCSKVGEFISWGIAKACFNFHVRVGKMYMNPPCFVSVESWLDRKICHQITATAKNFIFNASALQNLNANPISVQCPSNFNGE